MKSVLRIVLGLTIALGSSLMIGCADENCGTCREKQTCSEKKCDGKCSGKCGDKPCDKK